MRWNDLSETLHTIGIFNYTEYVALWEELLQYATCHIYSTENLLCRQVVFNEYAGFYEHIFDKQK